MLTLSDGIKAMLRDQAGAIITLYEIYHTASEAPLCWSSDDDITYDGKVYYKQAITHSELSYNTDGSINEVTLSVGNAERQIQYYIQRYDLLQKRVIIRKLYINANGDIQGDTKRSYFITSVKVGSSQADFGLSIGFDMFKVTVPRRNIFAKFCSHTYATDCAHYAVCGRTFARCREFNSTQNFGGFPGVRSQRLYI